MDIESFSIIAEKLTPTELVELLNEFLSEQTEILINISHKIPENLEHFQRIAEIIDNHTESIDAGRKRYRFYREQGYKPLHHEISAT